MPFCLSLKLWTTQRACCRARTSRAAERFVPDARGRSAKRWPTSPYAADHCFLARFLAALPSQGLDANRVRTPTARNPSGSGSTTRTVRAPRCWSGSPKPPGSVRARPLRPLTMNPSALMLLRPIHCDLLASRDVPVVRRDRFLVTDFRLSALELPHLPARQ